MVRVELLEDIDGIGKKGDYISMAPGDVEKYGDKVEVRRETDKTGRFI